MPFAGPPQFVDPFGNAYYVTTKSSSAVVLGTVTPGKPAPNFRAFVCTANWDRSIGRTLASDPTSGFTYAKKIVATDWILPVVFSTLLLTFSVLWVRNGRRSHLPEP